MKDNDRRLLYQYYLRGCALLMIRPVDEEEFHREYRRYQRYSRFVSHYQGWRRVRSRGPMNHPRFKALFIEAGFGMYQLRHFSGAVIAGRQAGPEQGEGGAACPAYRSPDLPPLVGAAAKLIPPLDPEPQWRDP
jgi:hypothetical protein